MADWIRLSTNLFDNSKIQMLSNLPKGDSYVSFWIRLLCMAGKVNNGGYVYVAENAAYTPQLFAAITGRPASLIKTMLKTMQELNMIDIDEKGIIYIVGWCEHQNTVGLEKIRQQTKERTRLYRERKKASQQNDGDVGCDASHSVTGDVTSNSGDTSVTHLNKNRIEKNKNRENENSLSNSPSFSITQLYEQKIGLLNSMIADRLADLIIEYGEARVEQGINIAHERGGRTLNYVQRCIENPITTRPKAEKTEYVDPFKAVFGDGGTSDGNN